MIFDQRYGIGDLNGIDRITGIRRARNMEMPATLKSTNDRRGGERANCTSGGSTEKSASSIEKYGKLE